MTESYYIGAYWGARLESPAECAERLLAFLAELASCHELVASWNEKADTFVEAMRRKIVLDRRSLEPLFEASEHSRDLGYLFSAWNGRRASGQRVSLTSICGCVSPVPGLYNDVVVTLPEPSDAAATLYEPDVLLCMLRAIVSAWEPDRALLVSHEYLERYVYPDGHKPPGGKPDVGWMTYLRARRLQQLAGPPPGETVDIPGRGTIFIVTRDHRFSAANPDDVERAMKLTAYLEASRALVPIPSNEPF